MPHPASMTGFARTQGIQGDAEWIWEVRSVNGRGLELRFRLPPGFDLLEPALREAGAAVLKRGNVSATLTLRREAPAGVRVDTAVLEQMLALVMDLHRRVPGSEPPRAEALLALPGVLRPASTELEPAAEAALHASVREGFARAVAALDAMRRQEGERIAAAMRALLDEIADLRSRAAQEAAGQPAAQRARMMEAVKALLGEVPALPEERIAQEVALLAARSDVREELDRLKSHVKAARALLEEAGPAGRRLDFLVQEFNREANTLCSKSASPPLTATGLKLKAAIEQLREQAQNIE
ncbi:MAG TPA: YicC/YloC family endoribonuclease [Acetobacteraceae bacterium]|nr:YicC/YloC family endoribonuclease [Acetobacteraceae bacterium]